LKGVGENLSDHYISRLSWKLKLNLSLNNKAHGLPLAWEILKFGLTRRGILSLPAGILGGFVKSDPGLETPDIQYHIANASFENPAKRVFDRFPGLTIGPCQLRPLSRGYVHIKSANSHDAPAIQPHYLADEQDCHIHVAGIKIARQIMQSPALSDLVEQETKPGLEYASDAELLAYARASGVTLYHPVSTCRMGPNPDAFDVVDERLRVYGLEGIRVVDASIMPELVSGNTNAPTIMIAEKAADMIRQDASHA
jgi:choline dehydrogenase